MASTSVRVDATVAASPKPGYQSTEFWTHVLTLVIAAGSFVAAVVHPGFTVPLGVEAAVAPASIAIALVSQLVYLVSRHGLKMATLAAVESWARSSVPDVVTAVEEIKPLVAQVPAIADRLAVVEGGLHTVAAAATAIVDPPAAVAPVAPVEAAPAPVPSAPVPGPIQAALAAANAVDVPPAA